jgi:hypothetical protein
MPHSIVYNSETQMIESKIFGDLTFGEAKEIIYEFAAIIKEQGCTLLLNDYREVKVKLSTLEIYEVPKIYKDILAESGLSIHHIKRALVVAEDLRDFLFFETVTFNQGQYAKVFKNVTEAREWLLRK